MQFADANGVSLRFQTKQGAGPTIVLIHEMGGALESWDYVWPLLKDQAAIRMDMRGFGQSEKPVGPISLGTLRDDIMDLLDVTQITGPVILVGVAVGAAVAIALAEALGARAAGLLALAPATGIPLDRHEAVRGLAQMLRQGGLRHFVETDTAPKAWPADKLARGPAFDLFRALQLACDPAALAETYHMLMGIDLAPVLATLDCPAILAAGKYDVARPRALVEPLANTMKNGQFVELETGHFMSLQTPELIADLIGEFAQRLTAAGPVAGSK